METKRKRKQKVVNKRLQWNLAWQTILTWVVGSAVSLIFPIGALFICGIGIAGMSFGEVMSDVSKAYLFPVLMLVMFLPLAIWHSFQFSNRVAGPMFRFKREIKKLLAGETIKPINLRKDDYFKDFAADFNTLAEKMGQLEATADQSKREEVAVAKEDEPELVGV